MPQCLLCAGFGDGGPRSPDWPSALLRGLQILERGKKKKGRELKASNVDI